MINTITKKDIIIDRKDLYLNTINQLTPFHFRILTLLYDTENFIKQNEITLSTNVTSGRMHFFQEALPDIKEHEIKLLTNDLQSKGLIENISLNTFGGTNGIEALKGFGTSCPITNNNSSNLNFFCSFILTSLLFYSFIMFVFHCL